MDSEQRRAIARSIAILVVGIIIIGVIVWAIFFRGSDDKKNTGNTSPTTSQPSDKKAGETNNQKTGQKAGETKPAATSGQSNTTAQNSRPQQLANVGPGSLLPLFVSATVGGVAVHALGRRYRQRKNTPANR